MTISGNVVINEPRSTRHGDIVPLVEGDPLRSIPPLVQARLELEGHLRLCGLARSAPVLKFGDAHAIVLEKMLHELDSPLSASLRARAAALAGALGLQGLVPNLRAIVLDEQEDAATRVAALGSVVRIGGATEREAVAASLRSADPKIRAAAYGCAAASRVEALGTLAREHAAKESDPGLRSWATRKLARRRDATRPSE
jgi:hypothetical protein